MSNIRLLLTSIFLLFLLGWPLNVRADDVTSVNDLPKITAIEEFLSSIKVNLPPATVHCKTSGSLSEIFLTTRKFTTNSSTFFVDRDTREIASFQRAFIDDPDKKLTIQVLMKVPNVGRNDLVDLLLKHKIVTTTNANIIFVIKESTSEGETTYINSAEDENGNPSESTIFTRVSKLRSLVYEGQKFIVSNGTIKIFFSTPPKKIDPSGNLVSVLSDSPGSIICKCNNCPIHNYDLNSLKNAFDGELVNDILNEVELGNNSDEPLTD